VSLSRLLNINESEFLSGLQVRSTRAIDSYRGSYTFLLVADPRFHLGLSLGVHFLDASFSITALNTFTFVKEQVVAPLPLVGVNLAYAATHRLTLRGRAEYTDVHYQDYAGRVVHLTATAEYRLTEHLSAGAGFEHYYLDVELEKRRSRFDIEQSWVGYNAFVTLHF